MDSIALHLKMDIDENRILSWKSDSGRTEDAQISGLLINFLLYFNRVVAIF
jgi:hypothetical protein